MTTATLPPTQSMSAFAPQAWLSVVIIGAFGGLTTSLQPLLLGTLRDAGVIDMARLGQIATAEAISMGIAVTLAGILLPARNLRPIAVITLALGAAANMATGHASAAAILPLRMVAGAASGLQLWLLLGLLARIALPARATGWYVILQGITALALSAIFSLWIIPMAGASGAYAILAGLGLTILSTMFWIPRSYAPIATETGKSAFVTIPGLVGLSAAAFQLAGIMAFWVYVLPTGQAMGVSSEVVHLAISCAIASQIVAGAAAIMLASLPARQTTIACAAASLASLVAIGSAAGEATFVIALSIYGFAWVFVLGFHVPLVIELDPTRRSVMLLTGMQLFGVAAGPFVTSLMLIASPASAPIYTSGILLCFTIAILYLSKIRTARPSA